ncbi:MAG: site-2 protease family protein [Chloroflexota bacterium]
MDTDTLVYTLLAAGIMLVIGFPVHEFCHAWAAYRLGDSTARWQGRLTLNPRVHFDPVGGVMLLITAILSQGSWFFGYAKPTPVNPMNLRGGRRGEAWVAAAGPLSNLVMAAIVAIPLRFVVSFVHIGGQTYMVPAEFLSGLPERAQDLVILVPMYFVSINVFLCIFNLLPVPPLDGWKVLSGLVPSNVAWQLRDFEQRYATYIPFVFLVVILFLGGRIISPIAQAIINLLLGA